MGDSIGRTISPLRVLAVTAGLVLTGGLVGGLCGAATLALVLAVMGEGKAAVDPGLLSIAAAFGAVVGAVFAPLMSWLFLRHVPLGRAIVQTALGTIIGGAIGFVLPTFTILGLAVPSVLWCGLLGFSAATLRLRLVTPRPERDQLPSG